MAGWRRAHEQRGLLPGPDLEGDWSSESGHRAGLRIATDPDITAVFAGNDFMALGILHALHEQGRRVPDDVSVVGFDDLLLAAHTVPALTTVRMPIAEIVRESVELAIALARDPTASREPRVIVYEPTLVIRQSTAPPPTGP